MHLPSPKAPKRGEKWGTPPALTARLSHALSKPNRNQVFQRTARPRQKGKPLSQGWKTLRHPKSEFFQQTVKPAGIENGCSGGKFLSVLRLRSVPAFSTGSALGTTTTVNQPSRSNRLWRGS